VKVALKIGLPVLALALGIVGAFWLVTHRKTVEPVPYKKRTPLIEVKEIGLVDHQPVIRSQGRVLPRKEVAVIPRIGGQVIEVSAKLNEGYLVDANEILIRIDDEDYRLNLRRAEADIIAAKASMTNALAQVASAQAQASQAEARLAAEEAEANAAREEWRLLKKDGDPPALLLRKPQIREARTAITAARALGESASAGIESGQASLLAAAAAKERAQLDLERCIIRAPFDARVVHGTVDLASTVSPANTVAVLQRVDFAEVRLPLSRRQLKLLGAVSAAKQYPVRVSIGDREWTARFDRLLGVVNPVTHTQSVIAHVANPYNSEGDVLRFGTFVEAELQGSMQGGVAVLPEVALRSNDSVYLFKNGELSRKVVRIIERIDGEVVVVGLSAADRVCVTELDSFVDGMSVRLGKGN
jgi:RND family efflux transporter MFP subunit